VKAARKAARGRPRDESLDAAILGAALALFRERGAEGVSVEQTAERAGVTRATVYRRFATREALVAGALARVRGSAERSLGPYAQASFAAMTDWMIRDLPRALAQPASRRLIERLIGSASSTPELLRTYWERVLAPRRRAFALAARRAQRRGEISRAHDPELLQDFIAGALLCEVLIRPGARDEAQIRRYLRRVLRELGVSDGARRGARARRRARQPS
jgi:AcrR family transcriptional regulator